MQSARNLVRRWLEFSEHTNYGSGTCIWNAPVICVSSNSEDMVEKGNHVSTKEIGNFKNV